MFCNHACMHVCNVCLQRRHVMYVNVCCVCNVCMYVCMHVRTYVRTYVCMYVCMHGFMYAMCACSLCMHDASPGFDPMVSPPSLPWNGVSSLAWVPGLGFFVSPTLPCAVNTGPSSLNLSVVCVPACHQAEAVIVADSSHVVQVVITLDWLLSS